MSGPEQKQGSGARPRRVATTILGLGAIVAAMLVLVTFSVPLYRLFCAATGFGGTTQRASVASQTVSDRVVTVRFSTDVAADLGWRFVPEQREVSVHLGEEKLVFFSAENLTDQPIVGHATFNVTPTKTGVYFDKVQCFCFSEERLGAHEKVDMPVDFFVDPKLADDPETREVDTITLSYTFYRSPDPKDAEDLSRFVASPEPDPRRGAALFAEHCAACHALNDNRIGPMLGGVVNRPAASVPGFEYSAALRQAGLRWTPEALNRWLSDPKQVVPGTKMPLSTPDATVRRDIIAYLQAQGGAARAEASSRSR